MSGLGVIFKSTDIDSYAGAEETTASGEFKRPMSMVHIRNQQRNNRKSLTTIAGLASDLDLHKILRFMRKMFNTNGTILHDEDGSEVIQLQGDRRREAAEFLTKYKICEADEPIKIHGAYA